MNTLDPSTERAARAFLSAIGKRYAVTGAVLYGSRARGDHTIDSDADLAVLLPGSHGSTVDTMLEMIDAAYAVELESGIVVSPLPIWQDQWDHPERFSNPSLLRNIQKEGVRL
ncbi:MAG: nucleotidyltransferase domain-containing protein [Acidocella sp.]|nr:nucleotidyltransferase domain-containing protein [Acidocella sp.]